MNFSNGDIHFAGLEAATVAKLVASAADIVLVLDADDKVLDSCIRSDDVDDRVAKNWQGMPVFELVAPDSMEKVEDLIASAREGKTGKCREVNHIYDDGEGTMVRYRCAQLSDQGRVVLLGQDMTEMQELQKRLMSVQMEMEAELSRLRTDRI